MPVADEEPLVVHAGTQSSPSSRVMVLAIALIILQVSLTIGIVVSEYLKANNKNHDKVQVLLCFYMAMCILFIAILHWRKKIKILPEEETSHHSNEYMLASVYVFGSGTIFLRIFQLYSYVFCINSPYDVVYAVFSLIFAIVQTVCVQMYKDTSLSYNMLLYFTMFLFIGTDISTYVTYVPYEMQLDHSNNFGNCTLDHPVSMSAIQWGHYMVPFVSEFSITCCGVIATVINKIQMFTPSEEPLRDEEYFTPSTSPHSTPTPTESEMEEIHVVRTVKKLRTNRQKDANGYLGLITGIVLGLVVTTSAICCQDRRNPTDHNGHLWFHYSVMVCVSLMQYYAFYKFKDYISDITLEMRQLRADDILLFFTAVGVLVWDILVIISCFEGVEDDDYATPILSVTTNLTQALCVIGQVFFLTHFQHIDVKLGDEWLKQYFYFLTITNLRFWVVDSFIGIKTSSSKLFPMSTEFYQSAWSYVSSFLYVLAIFFRFHSASICFEITTSKFEKEKHE